MGTLGGIALAILGGRLLRSLLFGVAPYDAVSIVAAAMTTAAVTMAVSYFQPDVRTESTHSAS